jgi:hypothetical protein
VGIHFLGERERRRRAYGDFGARRDGDPALRGELGAEDLRRAGDEAHAKGSIEEHLHAQFTLRGKLVLPRRRRGGGHGTRRGFGGGATARV